LFRKPSSSLSTGNTRLQKRDLRFAKRKDFKSGAQPSDLAEGLSWGEPISAKAGKGKRENYPKNAHSLTTIAGQGPEARKRKSGEASSPSEQNPYKEVNHNGQRCHESCLKLKTFAELKKKKKNTDGRARDFVKHQENRSFRSNVRKGGDWPWPSI